jgi:hypothetical protein
MPRYLSNIHILSTPTEPEHAVRLQDLANAVGEHFKSACRVATTAELAGTYASLTLTGAGNVVLPAIDGVNLSLNDRVLVTAQSDQTQNGIYTVTRLGDGSTEAWQLTRAEDFDASSEINSNVKVNVKQGTSLHDKTFVLETDDPITLDTTPLVWGVATGLVQMITQQTSTIVGDGTTDTFTLTHGWNTYDVTVEIIDNTDHATVYADVARTTVNAVTVSFDDPPAISQNYTVILRADL